MDSILGTVTDKLDRFLPGAKQQVKQLADKAKAYMNNMTDLEIKVMEATNHEPWGPHGTAMQEITNASFTSDGFQQIMGVLDERMAETGDNWRLVYKSLLLLEYMVKHGPVRIADAILSNRLHRLEMLRENFEYKDPTGRDQGINVRQRAGALVTLVSDRERLQEERERAAKTSGKFGGVSSSQMRYGGFAGGAVAGGGGGGSGYGIGGIGSGSFGSGGGVGGSLNGGVAYGGSGSTSRGGGGFSSDRAVAGGGGGSFGRRAQEEEADPVEATRRRIERLKADGALPESPGSGGGAAVAGAAGGGSSGGGFNAFQEESGLVDTPKGQARAPKKLSDVKVNPAISAVFAKGGLALAPPGAAPRGGGGGSGSGGGASGIDLLGDLMSDPVPAPPAAPAAGGGDDWDAFESAPAAGSSAAPATRAPSDGWAAFESAAPAPPAPAAGGQQQRKGPLDLDSLLCVPGPSAPGGPLPVDAFADFSAAPLAAAPAPAAMRAPAAAAAPPLAGGDPFAASFGMTPALASGSGISAHAAHAAAAAGAHGQQGKAKLGPETERAKDPFADLGAF